MRLFLILLNPPWSIRHDEEDFKPVSKDISFCGETSEIKFAYYEEYETISE